ncbi:hypothetical protein quinque_004771 [Culex quinquefasciatus]
MAADYSSYQNTLGRRSIIGGGLGSVIGGHGGGGGGAGTAPYTHMSKYSYPTDVSLSSHYGYTSWGLWRDSRNLSSSMYGKKQQQQKNFRSVSILLMTAAFLVVLAVLCVVGLAFYFSAFKGDLSESILVFDCTFRVTRGDIYTTGLRTNSTPVFRQKTAFYERLVGTSLEQSGLTVSRTEIMDFGDGPTIVLSFRVFLDMRKIKITINNVEEHIRQAILSELANPHSTFKNIRVDPDSIEIKRLLDHDVLRTAFLTKEEPFPPPYKISEDRVGPPAKKSGVIEKTIHKFTPKVTVSTTPSTPPASEPKRQQPQQHQHQQSQSQAVDGESDIDMDNLPVIQGSFEITKTDADITQKRSGGGGRAGGSSHPAQLKVRVADKKPQPEEKVTPVPPPSSSMRPATAKIEKTDKHGATTKKLKSTSSRGTARRSSTSTSTTTTTTTTTPATTTTTSTTPRTTIRSTTGSTTTEFDSFEYDLVTDYSITDRNDTLLENFLQAIINDSLPEEVAVAQKRLDENIPKLDVSLFTSAPILDKQPWQPIRATVPKEIPVHKFVGNSVKPLQPTPPRQKKPTLAEEILYRSKYSDIESALYTESPAGQVYYQSYTNPSFGSSTLGIEPLGVLDVRPYPLPVDKISLGPVPNFKYMTPTAISEGEKVLNLTIDEQKFEHLGGGVIVKKPENKTTPYRTTTESMKTSVITVTPVYVEASSENLVNSTDEYVEYYQVDGLNYTETTTVMDEYNETMDYGIESRIVPDEELFTTEEVATVSIPNEAVENFTEMSYEFGTSESLITTTELPPEEPTPIPTTELFMTVTETTTTTEQPPTTTPSTTTSTTSKRPTTFVEIETLKYSPTTTSAPATVTIPELFPINKWEFVNGSRVTPNAPSTRKVFNETLQAWIVENVQLSTTVPSVPIEDLRRKNTTNLQNLSVIFDTLASKLGIQTEGTSKAPPFASLAKIKNKNSSSRLEGSTTKKRNRTTTRPKRKKNKNRTTTTTTTSTTTTTQAPTTTTTTTIKPIYDTTPLSKLIPTVTNEDYLGDIVPVMLAPAGAPEFSSEYYVGQAEVEVIDPNHYDEMMRQQQHSTTLATSAAFATTTPKPAALVTLLPAKSNSGIKHFRPKIAKLPALQPSALVSLAASAARQKQKSTEEEQETGRKMSVTVMNANGGSRVASSGDFGGSVAEEGRDSGREFGEEKNNTVVEAVVRASMRFDE